MCICRMDTGKAMGRYGVFEYCQVGDKETLDHLVDAGLPNPESFSCMSI